MRINGLLQAALIVIVAGSILRHVPATAHPVWWPYLAFGYAFLATSVPWIIGAVDGLSERELTPQFSLLLCVISALPMWNAARWLAPTPYSLIAKGCWVMVGLWGVHLLASIVMTVRRKLGT